MLCTLGLNAQVQFYKLNWEEALIKAKAENKDVFVDVYRSKPFDKMRDEVYKTVFTDKDVSEFMNKNFICIAIDMSTKEGMAFAPKLYSLMYPCMVFYTAKGVQLESTNAYALKKDNSKLVELGKISIEKSKIKARNSRKILFSHISYEEALDEAKKQNKLVFIDAYTPWCRPCAQMAMHVFTLNKVADFHNKNFINLKIDFYKERPDLSEKFEVRGYPAFLYINGEGKLIHKAGGYSEADKFIGYGKEALKKFSGIKFEHSGWQNVLNKAKAEGKMVFIDCYTSWCGPCKMLAKDVFTQKKVGDFFNKGFVSLKLDMEKGEGKKLKSFLDVKAYPTLVFLDADKNIIHKVVGGVKAEKLIAEAQLALDGKGIALYEKKYNEGERNPEFLIDYLSMLESAYQKDKIAGVVEVYFENINKKDLIEKKNWKLINKYIADYNSREFKYLVTNQSEFAELHGQKAVANKIKSVWMRGANSFVKDTDGKKNLDEKAYGKYLKMLKRKKVEGYSEIKFYSAVNNALELGDWNSYINRINKGVEDKVIVANDFIVYNWALKVSQGCKEKALRKKAAKWAKDAVAKGSAFDSAFKKLIEDLEK